MLAEKKSWNLGDYTLPKPTSPASCKDISNDGNINDCDILERVTVDSDTHYEIGNYYQWVVATANEDASTLTAGTNAHSSICPSGWRLPRSGNTMIDDNDFTSFTNGNEFMYLLNKTYEDIFPNRFGAITVSINDMNKLVSQPIYLVRGGYVSTNGQVLSKVGFNGRYWSSTIGTGFNSYAFTFSDRYLGNDTINQSYGHSIRCVAE